MSATVQTPEPQSPEQVRTGTHVASLKSAILDNLFYVQGRFPEVARPNDWYQAVAYTVRDHMLHRWVHTAETYKAQRSRTVAYLSAEFLLNNVRVAYQAWNEAPWHDSISKEMFLKNFEAMLVYINFLFL